VPQEALCLKVQQGYWWSSRKISTDGKESVVENPSLSSTEQGQSETAGNEKSEQGQLTNLIHVRLQVSKDKSDYLMHMCLQVRRADD
jgi:hypothetical protein